MGSAGGIGWLGGDAEDWSESAGFAAAFGVLEAAALAVGFEDVAAVGEAIEGGAGEAFAAEDFGPVLER